MKIILKEKKTLLLHNPSDMPDPMEIEAIKEPWNKATIIVPDEFLGSILELCISKRGIQEQLSYADTRAMKIYKLPPKGGHELLVQKLQHQMPSPKTFQSQNIVMDLSKKKG